MKLKIVMVSFVVLLLSSCQDTGGKIEGAVSGGVLDNSPEVVPPVETKRHEWSIANESDYFFDSRYIEVAGDRASLKTVNTKFDSATSFNSGNHVGTFWNSSRNSVTIPTARSIAATWTPEHTNIVGYWKFDGNFQDSTSDPRNFSLISGAVVVNTNEDYIDGQSSIYITNSGLQTANYNRNFPDGFTASIWVKREINSGNSLSIFKRGNQFSIDLDADAKFFYCIMRGSETVQINQNPIPLSYMGLWTYVVCTFDPIQKTLSLYVNGKLEASVVTEVIPPTGSTSTSVRNEGYLDEAIIWNRPLNANQIAEIYNRQKLIYSNEHSIHWTPKWGNIVGYWKMDGNWRDSSGHNFHGVASGTPSNTNTAKIGSHSALFTGANSDSVTVAGAGIPLQAAGNKVSISAWINMAAITQDWTNFIGSGANRFRLEVSGGTTLWVFYDDGTSGRGMMCTNCIDQERWIHIVYTSDGANTKLYVNSELKDSIADTGPLNIGDDLFFGARTATTDYWSGGLDEVVTWNDTLTAQEISTIYNRQKQKFAGHYDSPVIDMGANDAIWGNISVKTPVPFSKHLPAISGNENSADYDHIVNSSGITGMGSELSNDLIAYWKMEETSGTTIVDSSGNGYDGVASRADILGHTGILGKGLHLSHGTPRYITTPTINLGDQFTISTWINLRRISSGQWHTIISNATTGSAANGFKFAVNVWGTNNGRVIFEAGNGTLGSQASTGNDVIRFLDEWTHLLVVVNRSLGMAHIYVNGVLQNPVNMAIRPDFKVNGLMHLGSVIPASAYMNGHLDEVAIWGRELNIEEIKEVYRRVGNRVKYQVRSCATADCANEVWLGPDGTSSTYYSELQNNASVDATGRPTGQVNLSGLLLNWANNFFTDAARPVRNQYFQYRAYLEATDSCALNECLPEISSITVGPEGRYYGGRPSIISQNSLNYEKLKTIFDRKSPSCISYQLSNDGGSSWKWWNGTQWTTTVSGAAHSNRVDELQNSIGLLGRGDLKFKAFLSSDLTYSCELEQVGVTYQLD